PAVASWTVPGNGSGGAQASPDFHAPSVNSATTAPVGMTAAGGGVRAGGQFVVYAKLSDPGGTGVASARADVSALTSGASSVALGPCVASCTIGSTTYTWSSAPVTADAGLTEGTKSFSVWGTDNTSNTGSPTPFPVTADNTNPTASAAVVVASATSGVGYVRQGGTYVVYASASDAGNPASGIATVTADVSAVNAGVTALSLPKCTSSCSVGGVTYGYKSAVTAAGSPLAEGAFSVPVTATDKAGGTGSFTASGAVDNTAPSVTAAAVVTSATSSAGYVKSGGTYIVYANASDGGAPASGIATVKADVSGITAGQTALTLSACTSSCTIGGVTYGYKSTSKTADTLNASSIGFTVTATDKASGASTGSFSVAVDNTVPVVTAAAVATTTTGVPGWLRKSGSYNVYANATDASGVATVKANVSTITSGQTALALTACTTGCTVGGVTYAWKSANKTAGSTLAAGAVSFTVTATDRANNSATASGGATVDNTVPTVSSAAVATDVTNVPGYASQGRDYVVYGDASDAASGMFKLTAKASNLTTGQTALVMPACVSSCSAGGVAHGYASAATTANASLSAGSKTYTLTATDNAGNTTTTANQTVVVDNTAPTVSITFPTAGFAGGWLAGCATGAVADVCGTATDATAGVAKVQVSFRQAAAPSLYWDPVPATFSSASEVFSSATFAAPSWSLPMAAAAFTNATGYTLRALVTDAAGNTATTSTTFTFSP
ncbi:MAG TPA: Ig-like domain-containing protein, partial [Gaiellales bacterium]|nr:Ig-like domain-containing protein [Gaiellales bacterium]